VRLFFFIGAVLLGLASAWAEQDQTPAIALRDLSGGQHNTAEYRGKVVILNFWATWCAPCKQEMPLLVEAQKRYGERIVVIGASLDDSTTQPHIPKFIRQLKINFPVWIGADPELTERLGLGPALPSTAFLDPEGRIVLRVLGQLQKRDLFPRIEWLLGDRKGSPPEPLLNNLEKPGKK